jgi:hypothetical protein
MAMGKDHRCHAWREPIGAYPQLDLKSHVTGGTPRTSPSVIAQVV